MASYRDSTRCRCSRAIAPWRAPELQFAQLGPSDSGQFYSHARRRVVGYTIAYPPGHRRGDRLPLVVMLHGFGGDHTRGSEG